MNQLLDLVGIFVFALSGALVGVRKRLDVVGMAVLAEMTALGGGIVRDLVLNVRPAAFSSTGYVLVPIAATAIVFFWHPHVQRVMPAVDVLDAAGLGLFCAVGTEKAMNFGLSPLHGALLGVTTAVGGGILRDILAGQIPNLLYDRQLYAVPAMLGSAVMAALYTLDLHGWPATLAAAVLAFGLRIAAMRLGLRAPLARGVTSE
ncbi:trimeric intracellular cation channel family protein [Streptosporangium sp. NBC_01639]|uniref:trimeric intracellular cation channel family protein n=1 Tax=unclassified Streptosporangium TaxID=2632669 RepID=UPI002DD9796F|nr:trimeric intracellular cation channel family protein [Streptosporangium sp. NBC_01756]WSC87100.1 trimeric intracellular cation channel family protein [Streptosporangium sp. NBC_01756]WTD54210.1 trimeric intracellular cation channel family protein [Streptosporangium sp. NBC_01639]